MLYLYPYNPHSVSARNLARALRIKRIKHENSKFRVGAHNTVVNWGSSSLPNDIIEACGVVNIPEAVGLCTNKLKFFEFIFATFPTYIPSFTTNYDVAANWIMHGKTVVVRELLNGSGGEGITLAKTIEDLSQAPLYTQYIPKREEYRVHVFENVVIDIQRKARVSITEDEDVNWQIRNHDNGFIYAREDISVPEAVLEMSKEIVPTLGLHFGAVDIIWNEKRGRPYVLEVNTAPGLEGTTLEIYTEVFTQYK